MLSKLCRFMLSTIVCVDMTTSASETFDHGAIDPNSAALSLLVYHRGASLAAAAFGWLAAPQDLALLAETLRATIEPDAPLELVRKHYLVNLCLEPYGKSSGPAQPRPGFGVMPAACACRSAWWAQAGHLSPLVRFVQSGCLPVAVLGVSLLQCWVSLCCSAGCIFVAVLGVTETVRVSVVSSITF